MTETPAEYADYAHPEKLVSTQWVADHAADLLTAAAAESVTEFGRTCRNLVRTLEHDDGTDRLERQRAQRGVKRWTDRDTGALCRGRID